MDKLFRQVSIKERLPEIEEHHLFWYTTSQGYLQFDFYNKEWIGNTHPVVFWMEEVELPTEEDINWKYPLNSNELHKTTLNVGCRNGAKYILNTLKGEKR